MHGLSQPLSIGELPKLCVNIRPDSWLVCGPLRCHRWWQRNGPQTNQLSGRIFTHNLGNSPIDMLFMQCRDERKYLFQSHSLLFPMVNFLPIPNPKFSLVLFPFPFHSHWLFSFTPAPISVQLVVSRSENKWPVNSTMHTTDKSSK